MAARAICFKDFSLSYWHEPADEALLPITMSQLIDCAAEMWGDDEAFVSLHENIRLSFKECKEKADKIAAGLLELGLNPGDTLALWGSVSSNVYLTMLAAARAGLIVAGIEDTENSPLLIHCLKKVKAKALVVIEENNDKNYCEMLHKAIPELSESEPEHFQSEQFPDLKVVITCGNTYTRGTFRLEHVLKTAITSSIEQLTKIQADIQPDDRFKIHFTSGSTGMPKAVPVSHSQLINGSYQFGRAWKIYKFRSRILGRHHVCERTGMERYTLPAFLFGCTTVFASVSLNMEDLVKALQNERCTLLLGAPSFCLDIITYAKKHNMHLNYPETAIVGGAPLTEKIAAAIFNVLPVRRIITSFGMTEGGGFCYNLVTNDINSESLFQVAKNFEVKVVNNDGKMVPKGELGELCVRGNSVMKDYLNEEENTAKCITPDGWLKTGDNCILQENGFIKLVGRVKDMLIRDSKNIFPIEIENFLNTHPLITEVHAFGVPDPRHNEELCVYIRKNDGVNLTEEDVIRYCKGKLSDYKIPRYVRFVDEFPRDARLKVNKRMLMELFKKDEEYIQENTDADIEMRN